MKDLRRDIKLFVIAGFEVIELPLIEEEVLRLLEAGYPIKVIITENYYHGVDTRAM